MRDYNADWLNVYAVRRIIDLTAASMRRLAAGLAEWTLIVGGTNLLHTTCSSTQQHVIARAVAVITQIVIQRQLGDVPRLQELDHLLGPSDIDPSGRRCALVIQIHFHLPTINAVHFIHRVHACLNADSGPLLVDSMKAPTQV